MQFMSDAPSIQKLSPDQSIEQLKLQLAIELAPRRWRTTFLAFAKQISAGLGINEAIANSRPPRPLANLLRAVSDCPDPFATLTELLAATRKRTTLSQAFTPLVYPLIVVALTFLMTSLLAWIGQYAVSGTEWVNWATNEKNDFIRQLFHAQWSRSVAAGTLLVWSLIVVGVVLCLAPRMVRLNLVIHVPWFGKLARWSMLRDLVERLGIFIGTGISADQATECMVQCYRGSLMEIPARGIAKRIRLGQPIDEAIRKSILCDEFLRPATLPLEDARQEIPTKLAEFETLVDSIFEQRRILMERTGSFACYLLVLCMYAHVAMDLTLALLAGIQSFIWGMGRFAAFAFFGQSEGWVTLFPIAVVNFIFLHSMFRQSSFGRDSFSVAVIKLFAAVCCSMALIGLAFRCSFVDFLYLPPFVVFLLAIRRNTNAMKRASAAQVLMSSRANGAMGDAMARQLQSESKGSLRRRLKNYRRCIRRGLSNGESLATSRLVTDPHQRWLATIIDRFGNLPETRAILSGRSPWTELSSRLMSRVQGLQWTIGVSIFGIGIFALFYFSIVRPTQLFILQEMTNWNGATAVASTLPGWAEPLEYLAYMVVQDLFDPFYATWMSLLLLLILSLAFLLMLISSIPAVHARMNGWWMAPAYRAWTLRGISEALQRGPNVLEIIRQSSTLHPISSYRKRLRQLALRLESGVPLPEAFAKSKLIRSSQRGMLKMATEPSQLAWSLHQISHRNYFRWIERAAMVVDVLSLLVVLASALVIGTIAYAEFTVIASAIRGTVQ